MEFYIRLSEDMSSIRTYRHLPLRVNTEKRSEFAAEFTLWAHAALKVQIFVLDWQAGAGKDEGVTYF